MHVGRGLRNQSPTTDGVPTSKSAEDVIRVLMRIWEFIGSTAEVVKRNTPDGTLLKSACRTSYSYDAAAFTKIDQAVRINALGQWMPDDETKSKIGLFTAEFAKNAGLYAVQEGYKLIPGEVAVSKIVTKTLNDVKHENLKEGELEAWGEKLPPIQKRYTGGRNLIDGAEMHVGRGLRNQSPTTDGVPTSKSAEDVIRVLMRIWEFIGSTAEVVKRNTPDGTLLKSACRTSYSYGAAAFTKIDQAVRINALGQWMPDDETKSKIGLFTAEFAKKCRSLCHSGGLQVHPRYVDFCASSEI
ncbi:UNVERIFIED_CONTAM: hypothetical protein Sradi_6390700 [Sesamum radiatum]|uniref:Uncharacterized protein n=1 Tax=Sesamum radiatum TaxID=300843 RepID=A0AAW2K2V3_SESRA